MRAYDETIRIIEEHLGDFEYDPRTGRLITRSAEVGGRVGEFNPDDFFGTEKDRDRNELEIPDDVLGHYEPMSSPGRVVLHGRRIAGFCAHILKDLLGRGFTLFRPDVERIMHFATSKVYEHEEFHMFSDVQSHLILGFTKQVLVEEALATAHAYQRLREEHGKWNSKLGMIHLSIWPVLLEVTFDRITRPGYRDWRKYASPDQFVAGLGAYFHGNHPKAVWLQGNGIPTQELLAAQLALVKRFQREEDVC
ncbi:MAG: hypothetical protein V1809_05755 [Planctomycetota bacterium]